MKTKFKSVFKTLSPKLMLGLGFLAPLLCAAGAQAGSLWREAVTDERGMYSDRKARRIGDIVTVVITETLIYNNTRGLTTAREVTGNPGLAGQLVNSLIGSVSSKQSAVAANDPVRRKFPMNLLPKTQAELTDKNLKILDPLTTDSSTAGTGGLTNRQVLNFTMAVQVIDTLPNGNLVIEGIRQIGFSKERQFISLRGIVRPVDIMAGVRGQVNVPPTVQSIHIADARIEVVSEGVLTETAKKGWLQRLDDKITPY
jgi:flagellar L-ring protein precursor FlgH